MSKNGCYKIKIVYNIFSKISKGVQYKDVNRKIKRIYRK